MQSKPPEAASARLDDVLAMFSKYQRRLYQYIVSMLPGPAEAEEVLQETNIVVWRKFDQFRPDSDFRAWIFQIAYYEVRKFLERKRRAQVCFSVELLDELSERYHSEEEVLEERRAALTACVRRLPPGDRELVDRVYAQGVEVAQLAEQVGRERTSIYRSLRRIRQALLKCVERTLTAEGSA